MSNVSHIHAVIPFIAGKTIPLTGQRLAKIGYKVVKDPVTKKQVPAKYPSIAVSVPMLDTEHITANIDRLLPMIQTMLEDGQDNVIRSLYEGRQGLGFTSVGDADISVDAIIAFMESENAGGKLTKAAIVAWFTEQVSDNLFCVIAQKLGFIDSDTADGTEVDLTEAQDTVVNQHLNGYKDVLSSLAGGATILGANKIAGCKAALALASSEDTIVGTKLAARLRVMETPKTETELLAL